MGNRVVIVNDKMQTGYRYELSAPRGAEFAADFLPELTPAEMLALGVFGGHYMTDCGAEFPREWFQGAKLNPLRYDVSLNFFGVRASQPLRVWREKGWINEEHDPRGWFQWYCRYYMGRRLGAEDVRQVRRWVAYRRHYTQVVRHCEPMDYGCRRRQRQSLLHWAYDARRI